MQLWDVAGFRRCCSSKAAGAGAGAGAGGFLSSSSSSFVSAEWIAHDGPITSMAARPTPAPKPKPALSATKAATARQASSSARNDPISNSGGGGGGGGEDDVEAAADVVVGVDAHTHLLLSRSPPAVATGGGDGVVRVWTDEGMAAGTYYGGSGGAAEDHRRQRMRSSSGGAGGGSTDADRSGHEGAVLCVCWHPSGDLLASAGQDWAIWLWNAEGRALSYIHAHQRWTRTLAFSDNGEFLASYAAGGALAGWSVAVTGKKQVFTIRWKHPKTLIATHAEVGKSREGRPGSTNVSAAGLMYVRQRKCQRRCRDSRVCWFGLERTVVHLMLCFFFDIPGRPCTRRSNTRPTRPRPSCPAKP